jgi:hypothetical protein
MREWVDTLQRAVSVAFKLSLGGETSGSGDLADPASSIGANSGGGGDTAPNLGTRVEVVVPNGAGKLGMHIGMVLDVGQTGRVAVLGLTAGGRAQVGCPCVYLRCNL